MRGAATCLTLIALAALATEPAQAHGRGGRWWAGEHRHRRAAGLSSGYYGPTTVPATTACRPIRRRWWWPPPVALCRAGRTAGSREAPPEPIFYPRQGQSAAQVEADRQECNRWATTQPAAMADASVFHRATLACMDAHGYTAR